MAGKLEWLRERLQDDAQRPTSIDPDDAGTSSVPADDGMNALELVYQAAEMIQGMTDRAGEAEARARLIVESAIDKLEAAESRHRAEQIRQRDKLDEAAAELAEAGRALKQLQIRIEAAEARAVEAKEALLRIENAIRVHLLRERRDATRDFSVAA